MHLPDHYVCSFDALATPRNLSVSRAAASTYRPSRELQHHLIHVAPAPRFSRLKRTHDGVPGLVKMFGCVLVGRRIAAPDVPAFQAQSKMYPPVPRLEAFLTTSR